MIRVTGIVFVSLGVLIGSLAFSPGRALADDDDATRATPVIVQMPDGTYRQGYAIPVQKLAPEPEPKQFAVSANPLNLYIRRYGFNFEYQPTLHHGAILSPHYDSVDENANSFSGYGAEFGYRFYSGNKGFNGLFAGLSLLLATYNASGNLFGDNVKTSFSSIGWAWEVGGQAQLGGGFIIGGGGGLQHTKVSKPMSDLPLAAAVIAGGGWRPRALLNLGYAF